MRSARRLREALAERFGLRPARRRDHRHVRSSLARGARRRRDRRRGDACGGGSARHERITPVASWRSRSWRSPTRSRRPRASSMGKAERVPAALVRGIDWDGDAGAASELVRSPTEDLFRESPLQSLHARRTIRAFGPGAVPREVVARGRRGGLHGARAASHPALALRRRSTPRRRSARCSARSPRRGAPTCERTPRQQDVIERRLARSDAVLGAAPTLIVPFVRFDGAHPYPDAERGGCRARDVPARGRRGDPDPAAGAARSGVSRAVGSARPCSARRRRARCSGSTTGGTRSARWPADRCRRAEPRRPRPPIDPSDFLRWS